MSLAEELVSIADHLFLHGFWKEILMGQRQILTLYLLACDACSRMALAHSCMALEAFTTHQFGTQTTMTDVGLTAKTHDAGSIGKIDSDVVKHGCLFHKLSIKMQFGMRQKQSVALFALQIDYG